MDYIIDTARLATLPSNFFSNNPVCPLPDCANLSAVYEDSPTGKSKILKLNLKFGHQILTAHHDRKTFSFSIGLRKAKLQVIALDGARVIKPTVRGTQSVSGTTLERTISNEKILSSDGAVKLNAAARARLEPQEFLNLVASIGLSDSDRSVILTKIEEIRNLNSVSGGFDSVGPFWNFLPNVDLIASVSSKKNKREHTLSGAAISFGDEPLFRFEDTSKRKRFSMDPCIIFGVSANSRDIEVDLHFDDDEDWWLSSLRKFGFEGKKEIAKIAVRNILAQRISEKLPEQQDGDLLFVVAAAEPNLDPEDE